MKTIKPINTVLGEMTLLSHEMRHPSMFRPVEVNYTIDRVADFAMHIIDRYTLRLSVGVDFSASGSNEFEHALKHSERLLVRHMTAAMRPLVRDALAHAYDGDRSKTIEALEDLYTKLDGVA